jgi:hypothetical protein
MSRGATAGSRHVTDAALDEDFRGETMSGFHGGDTEQMRQQGTAFEQGSRTVADITDAASKLIDSVPWLGPDAVAFRALWHGTIEPALRARAEGLQDRGEEIRRHAEEQDETSAGDGGGLLDGPRDRFPMPFPGPLMPLPAPMPGLPLSPGVIDHLRKDLEDWLSGGGGSGPQEFFGDPGFGSRGAKYGDDRPIGEQLAGGDSLWDGREVDEDFGFIDGYAGYDYSAGTNVTTDPHGNVTGSVGARGSAEIGLDTRVDGPFGTGLQAGTRAGAEGYAELGGTVGPDGFAAGGRAGLGAYLSQYATVDGMLGSSLTGGQDLYAGANASANAYSHITRNEDGQINGFSQGFDARAFAGAQATQTIAATSPGGWFSGSTSFSEKAGYGVGLGAGQTISTDEVSLSVSGSLAAELGLGGATTVAIHPNQIFDSFTPGDYDIDDAISDASGAFQGASDYVSDRWPF